MPVVSRPPSGRPPRLVYVRSFADNNIWRVETSAPGAPASSPPVVFISSTRQDYHPQLSPDGRRVAFVSRSGEPEIWVADLDGSNAVRLTSGRLRLRLPPLVSRRRTARLPLQHGRAVGGLCDPCCGRQTSKSHLSPGHGCVPSFSRDGKWIYFSSNRTGAHQIWKMPASGGDAVPGHNERRVHAPCSRRMAPTSITYRLWNTPSPLWRVPASGGAPVKVLDGVLLGNFVVLEGGIYYIDRPSGQGGVPDDRRALRRDTASVLRFRDPQVHDGGSQSRQRVPRPSRPLRTAARFSIPGWTPPWTT